MFENINSAVELANDEKFIRWVKSPNPADDIFWEAFLKIYPEKKELINEARELVLAVEFAEETFSKDEIDQKWQVLQSIISNKKHTFFRLPSSVSENSWYKYASVAAVIFPFIIVSFLFLLFYSGRLETIKTTYGERKSVTLPDGSIVTLNSNSQISYLSNWEKDQDREVKLKGEAFFNVKHKNNNQRFVVVTDNVKVEVLGTEFNVNSRRNKSQVVLSTGKIRLEAKINNKNNSVVMKPGELVEVKSESNKIVKKLVSPDKYTSWQSGRIIFNNTSIEEIVEMIEDNYGYSVHLADKDLSAKRIYSTTAFEARNIGIILTIISEIYDVNIEVKENKVIEITKR